MIQWNYFPFLSIALIFVLRVDSQAQFKHPVKYSISIGRNEQHYSWADGFQDPQKNRKSITVGFRAEKNLNLLSSVVVGLDYLRSGLDFTGYTYQFGGLVFGHGSSSWDNIFLVMPFQYMLFPISPINVGYGVDFRFLLKSQLQEEHIFYDDATSEYSIYHTSLDITNVCRRLEPHLTLTFGFKLKRFSVTYRMTWNVLNRYPHKLAEKISDREAAGSYMVESAEKYKKLSEMNNQFVLAFKIN